jgi:hypothetical protein
MSTTVTINPPNQIIVEAINQNEYNVIITAQSGIQVSVSPQSGLQGLKGDIGIGVPTGGYKDQALKKLGDGDYDFHWVTDDIPHGLDKEIQFNDGGIVGSDANFLYDKDAHAVSIGKAVILPNNPLAISGDIDGYIQVNIQNKNIGIDASSDFVATTDDGDDENNYIDMGINNSNYNDPDFGATSRHDGYVLLNGGNLVIGTLTNNKIKLLIGGGTSGNIIGEINASGLNMYSGIKVKENGFNLTDMIVSVNSATAETVAFAAGSKIVIRSDLL